MNKIIKVFTCCLFVSVFQLVNLSYAETLTIGRVSNDPASTYKQLKPILDYVVRHLGEVGIQKGSIVIAKNQDEMINLLRQGKVDWAQKGVFQALLYTKETAAEIALRSWRDGVPSYYSVIFARQDSAIKTLKELIGKKIAFQDRGSTSAYAIPVAMLRRAGIELVELASPRDPCPPNKVGYAFAGKELTIATWVHRRLVDAGAYHNQDWARPDHTPEVMKKDLEIIHRGDPMPRMVELFRRDLNAKVKQKLKDVLLKMHEDPSAAEALIAYGPKTAKFDEFNGQARQELNEAISLARFFTTK